MSPVFLHGFGERYDLPISLALYLFAGGAVVVLSFVLVVLFAGNDLGEAAVDTPRWRAAWLDSVVNSKSPRAVGSMLGVLFLAAIVVTGLLGSPEPTKNPAEYLLWIYFWAGLVILSGLVGNLWTLFSPWPAIHWLLRRLPLPPGRELPEGFGVWPAVGGYLLFACLELTLGIANRPSVIASATLLYVAITIAGIVVYGRQPWLSHCDPFTVLFEIVGRFAPVEIEEGGEGRLEVYLRPWGTGLLRDERPGWSWVMFVVLMLSTLAFDGLLATSVAGNYISALEPLVAPLGSLATPLIRTVGLLLLTGIFAATFVAVMRIVMWLGWPEPQPDGARRREARALIAFALTLVPIALVYNAAHNYGYLVVQSQGLIPLLADPLGRGWNLLPTAGFEPSFLFAAPATVWYVQVALIVLGHVIAVYLAHLRAAERFRDGSRVLLSQYPMLGLMVLYTMTSLWILAQPITREVGLILHFDIFL